MRKLKELNLGRNKDVTDESVEVIAKLPQLEDLSLWECSITEKSTDLLMGMKKLKELSVAQTGFSRAAEKRLMKAIEKK